MLTKVKGYKVALQPEGAATEVVGQRALRPTEDENMIVIMCYCTDDANAGTSTSCATTTELSVVSSDHTQRVMGALGFPPPHTVPHALHLDYCKSGAVT